MTKIKSRTFYRFVGYKNENLGIKETDEPQFTMQESLYRPVAIKYTESKIANNYICAKHKTEIGGYQLVGADEAIKEILSRKENPLPMDFMK